MYFHPFIFPIMVALITHIDVVSCSPLLPRKQFGITAWHSMSKNRVLSRTQAASCTLAVSSLHSRFGDSFCVKYITPPVCQRVTGSDYTCLPYMRAAQELQRRGRSILYVPDHPTEYAAPKEAETSVVDLLRSLHNQ
jgi:hypothetical protein